MAQVALSGGMSAPMGLIVDRVEEVVNLAADQIEPTPAFGVHGQVKTLLDIDRIVGSDTLESIVAPAAAPASNEESN